VQGSSLRWVIRWLKVDNSAERAEVDQMWQRGIGAATAAVAAPAGDEDFEKQRTAVGAAATTGEIDEETARSLIADIDLRQAASHTFKES
jgi:CPA1 family monovalent cation:H+ antiporter